MKKIIFGVIAGFVVWSILWLGINSILRAIWSGYNQSSDVSDYTFVMLVVTLVASVICSILAGCSTALIARENSIAPLILGFLLLLVGVFVQLSNWEKIPLWYHLTFWFLLIPMTVFGGKLIRTGYREVRRNY